jgi:hypothetical protein
MYQHLPLQDPPKFTQNGIFGVKLCHLAALSSSSGFCAHRLPTVVDGEARLIYRQPSKDRDRVVVLSYQKPFRADLPRAWNKSENDENRALLLLSAMYQSSEQRTIMRLKMI